MPEDARLAFLDLCKLKETFYAIEGIEWLWQNGADELVTPGELVDLFYSACRDSNPRLAWWIIDNFESPNHGEKVGMCFAGLECACACEDDENAREFWERALGELDGHLAYLRYHSGQMRGYWVQALPRVAEAIQAARVRSDWDEYSRRQ